MSLNEPNPTIDDVLDGVHAKGFTIRMPLLLALVAFSVAVAIFAAVTLLGGFADTDDTLRRASMAGCERNNLLRREVNRQAEAFVHHNDATLAWALEVRPVLREAGTAKSRRAYEATGTLIRAYREVRNQYFTLPLVNCKDPAPSGRGPRIGGGSPRSDHP